MDSITPEAKEAFADRLHPVAEQDSTDFAKSLSFAANWNPSFILAVGFLGARLDHGLAVLSHLAARRIALPDPAAAPPVLLLSAEDCVTLLPNDLTVALAPGLRVSLWPLGPSRLRSEGLRWPLDGLVLDPAGRVGTSNEVSAADGVVRLRGEGACLLLLPARALDALMAGLGFPAAEG